METVNVKRVFYLFGICALICAPWFLLWAREGLAPPSRAKLGPHVAQLPNFHDDLNDVWATSRPESQGYDEGLDEIYFGNVSYLDIIGLHISSSLFGVKFVVQPAETVHSPLNLPTEFKENYRIEFYTINSSWTFAQWGAVSGVNMTRSQYMRYYWNSSQSSWYLYYSVDYWDGSYQQIAYELPVSEFTKEDWFEKPLLGGEYPFYSPANDEIWGFARRYFSVNGSFHIDFFPNAHYRHVTSSLLLDRAEMEVLYHSTYSDVYLYGSVHGINESREYYVYLQDFYVNGTYKLANSATVITDQYANISGLSTFDSTISQPCFYTDTMAAAPNGQFRLHIRFWGFTADLHYSAPYQSLNTFYVSLWELDRGTRVLERNVTFPLQLAEPSVKYAFQSKVAWLPENIESKYITIALGEENYPIGITHDDILTYSNVQNPGVRPSSIQQTTQKLHFGHLTNITEYNITTDSTNEYSDFFYALDSPVNIGYQPYSRALLQELVELKHPISISAGPFKTFNPVVDFAIYITYEGYEIYQDMAYYQTTEILLDENFFFTYISDIMDNFTVRVLDANGLVYSETLDLADFSYWYIHGIGIDIDLGSDYIYPSFPKESFLSLYSYDGLGLDSNLFRVYLNQSRVAPPIVTFYTMTMQLLISDFFNQSLVNVVLSYQEEFDVYLPVYTMIVSNNFSEAIRVKIERSGVDIDLVQVIPAQSGLYYRFLANQTYRLKFYYLNGTLIDERRVSLDENNMLVSVGFYSELVPIFPVEEIQLEIKDYLLIALFGAVGFAIIAVLYIRAQGQLAAAKPLKRPTGSQKPPLQSLYFSSSEGRGQTRRPRVKLGQRQAILIISGVIIVTFLLAFIIV